MEMIEKFLLDFNLHPTLVKYLSVFGKILFIGLICVVANFITKKIFINIIARIVKQNNYSWGEIILERKVFRKLSHIVPAIIIYFFAPSFPSFQVIIEKFAVAYIIIVSLAVINSFLNAVNDIYQTYEISKTRPIKGFIQVLKIIMIILGVIIIIANFIGKSPLVLLGGIGALSAVLMLVFQDSILGLVAGIQLSANDMVRVGDWIEMTKYGADGDVIDVSLNTIKVRNFDNTIVTIPTYAMIKDSFKNWRGMQASGGRRIKRSLIIDTTSIRFCTEEMIDKFSKIHYLSDYISKRQKEIEEYNINNNIDRSSPVNGRALTNIGVFREYITNYLKNHPGIRQDMSLMVRQLAPNEHGLPLEIYAFTNDTRWTVYESIQSDIFDHLFAVAKEFGLRLFQNPSGHDLRTLKESME
jgi:miniconductance mechanosensitive channel